jgi:hypothetical protein
MATFCTKCGVALSPDKNFCPACGVPAAASGNPQAPTSAPVYPQAAAYQAPTGTYPAAATAPAGPGASAFKIILILVGVVVGLGLLLMMVFAFGAWRVSRAVHMSGAGNGITFSTRRHRDGRRYFHDER